MKKQQILEILENHKGILQEQYGIKHLALFGSTARDTATETSDIDILISFEGIANSQRYFSTLFYLEDLLQKPIDLITDKAIRSELRPHIESDLIYV
ncbi:nucleotidyltransferase family protein [Sodalinema gerasimenkoae]|uniref:nucleotidyltransferase family protein n=1 Tax=Sodalinema gerasimenkoae TaxID=2862348 RepID=UPI00135A43FA|nr:nucleotidyltransferase family protein [Sodalinema gerasimenkoae]